MAAGAFRFLPLWLPALVGPVAWRGSFGSQPGGGQACTCWKGGQKNQEVDGCLKALVSKQLLSVHSFSEHFCLLSPNRIVWSNSCFHGLLQTVCGKNVLGFPGGVLGEIGQDELVTKLKGLLQRSPRKSDEDPLFWLTYWSFLGLRLTSQKMLCTWCYVGASL